MLVGTGEVTPRWTICTATVGARNADLGRLLALLAPQVQASDGQVEGLVYWDNFDVPLGTVRQRLLDEVASDYVCFVDDDDRVPDYYVSRVLPLLDGVDYVGWRMQLYVDGRPAKPTFHSLRYDRWWDDADGYYRHVSHLNPIRTDLARLGRFDRGEGPEDVDWAHQVAPHVRSEHYIEDVMYEYMSIPSRSLWAQRRKPRGAHPRPVLPAGFRFHPASAVGV